MNVAVPVQEKRGKYHTCHVSRVTRGQQAGTVAAQPPPLTNHSLTTRVRYVSYTAGVNMTVNNTIKIFSCSSRTSPFTTVYRNIPDVLQNSLGTELYDKRKVYSGLLSFVIKASGYKSFRKISHDIWIFHREEKSDL